MTGIKPQIQKYKTCTKCKEIKPLSEFYLYGNKKEERLFSACKGCEKASSLKRYHDSTTGVKERKLVRSKERNAKLRKVVINHYGGTPPRCSCCGEKQWEFLCLDHIDGGGNKDRKSKGGGWMYYRWFEKNNFPKGFQVLCHNCNMAKGCYGFCPHEVGV